MCEIEMKMFTKNFKTWYSHVLHAFADRAGRDAPAESGTRWLPGNI